MNRLLILTSFLCLACLPVIAFASAMVTTTPERFVVEIQEPIQNGITYIFAALAGLAAGLMAYLFDPTTGKLARLKIDETTRGYLETAIKAGLQYAENVLRAEAKDLKDPVVHNQLLAIAVNYVLPRVPDALEHFGIDPTDLRAMIYARFIAPEKKTDVIPS